MRILAIVLLVIGVVLLAVGIVYYTVPANNLPALLGHLAHTTRHRTKRGLASLVLGGVSLIGGGLAFRFSSRA